MLSAMVISGKTNHYMRKKTNGKKYKRKKQKFIE